MASAKSAAGTFRVGDRVFVPWSRPVIGQIVEDRGPIGRHGRRLYSVRISIDPGEPTIMELPEDDLEPATQGEAAIDTQQIIDYLTTGGLIAILRTNLSGGRDQPRVWLRKDSVGNVVYTFAPEPGLKGGQMVPFNVLHGGPRIFEPKIDEVASFLGGFGLDRSQALDVIRTVGTAP